MDNFFCLNFQNLNLSSSGKVNVLIWLKTFVLTVLYDLCFNEKNVENLKRIYIQSVFRNKSEKNSLSVIARNLCIIKFLKIFSLVSQQTILIIFQIINLNNLKLFY